MVDWQLLTLEIISTVGLAVANMLGVAFIIQAIPIVWKQVKSFTK